MVLSWKDLEALPEAAPEATGVDARVEQAAASWQRQREEEYERSQGLFLVHVYKPSDQQGQEVYVFIYLVKHVKGTVYPLRIGISKMKQAEFYFGGAWGHQIFTVVNTGGNILGVRAHAYGTFLATCRVTFVDSENEPIIVHRYINCEMFGKPD